MLRNTSCNGRCHRWHRSNMSRVLYHRRRTGIGCNDRRLCSSFPSGSSFPASPCRVRLHTSGMSHQEQVCRQRSRMNTEHNGIHCTVCRSSQVDSAFRSQVVCSDHNEHGGELHQEGILYALRGLLDTCPSTLSQALVGICWHIRGNTLGPDCKWGRSNRHRSKPSYTSRTSQGTCQYS